MIYLLLIFVAALLAIIDDLIGKKDTYSLFEVEKRLTVRGIVIKVIAVLLVLGFMILGLIGILSGADNGIF
jgi:quinol-cytochrome oxidoreductase complex cytochrome b subunit